MHGQFRGDLVVGQVFQQLERGACRATIEDDRFLAA